MKESSEDDRSRPRQKPAFKIFVFVLAAVLLFGLLAALGTRPKTEFGFLDRFHPKFNSDLNTTDLPYVGPDAPDDLEKTLITFRSDPKQVLDALVKGLRSQGGWDVDAAPGRAAYAVEMDKGGLCIFETGTPTYFGIPDSEKGVTCFVYFQRPRPPSLWERIAAFFHSKP